MPMCINSIIAVLLISFSLPLPATEPSIPPLIPKALAATMTPERIKATSSIDVDPWDKVPTILKRIAACESSYEHKPTAQPRQFEPDGTTVRYGRVDHDDTGAFQINTYYHGREARLLGYDIDTEEGNINFA